MPTWPTIAIEADWVHGPNDGVQTWTSLQSTGHVIPDSFTTKRGRQYELGTIEAGTASINLQDFAEYLNPANTSSPWNSAGNSLKLYRQCHITATWSGTTYPLFSGYIERYQDSWVDAGFRGQRTLTCVDATALLNRLTINAPMAQATILADNPVAFWPLSDPSSTPLPGPLKEMAGNFTTATWIPATIASGPVATPTTFTLGAPSTVPYSEGATQLTFSLPTGTMYSSQISTDVPTGLTTTAVTLEAWITQSDVNADYIAVGLGQGIADTTTSQVSLYYNAHSGFGPRVDAVVADSTGTNIASLTNIAVSNGPHHFAITVTPTLMTLYVDGVSKGTVAGSFVTAPLLGAVIKSSPSGIAITAVKTTSVANVAAYNTALPASTILRHATAGLTGFASEPTVYNSAAPGTAWGRAKRVLTQAGFTGYGYTLDDSASAPHNGQSLMSAAIGWVGATAKSLLDQIVATEQGLMYCGGDGVLRVRDRQTVRALGAPRFTLGDGAGELPYAGDIVFSYDPTHAANAVTVTQASGFIGYASDATSLQEYGPLALGLAVQTANDADASAIAAWYLNQYKEPLVRVERVTIDPASNAALWPIALSLDVNDVVTVTRRPPAGSTNTGRYVVQSVAHDVAPGKWLTTFELAPAATSQGFIVDDPVYGVWDGTTPFSN